MWTAAGHAERCKALQSLSARQVAQRVWVQDNQPSSRGSAATSQLLLPTAHTAWSRPAPSCTEQCAMSHLSITRSAMSPGCQPTSYPSPPQPRLHHHTNTSTRSHMHTHTHTNASTFTQKSEKHTHRKVVQEGKPGYFISLLRRHRAVRGQLPEMEQCAGEWRRGDWRTLHPGLDLQGGGLGWVGGWVGVGGCTGGWAGRRTAHGWLGV